MKDSQVNTWTVELEWDGDEAILPLPQEVIDIMELKYEDTLKWIDNGNGTWTLQKLQYDSDSGLTENL